MAINLAEYAYKLTLNSSEYTRNMQEAETQANSMKSKLSGVGDFLKASLTTGLLAAGAAIGATIVSGVKATAELDQQMSQFRATTGATAEEAEKIRALSQELFKTNTDSMEDIVATATEMTKTMGMTTDEVEKYQQKYLDYAKTTSQSNVDVIKAIDDIGDAWGLTAEDSSKSLDMLKASSQEFGTDISSVQSTLSSVAPAAKALGLSLEETNGYMNLFAANGLDAAAATTAFTYAAKTVKSPEEFKKMLADVQAIADPTQRAQAAVELFGARAGIALSNALDTTPLDSFIVTMDEAAGTVSNASDAFDSNFNVQLELIKKQFTGLAQGIGEKLMPVLQSVMTWVSDHMPQIMSTIDGAINFISGLIQPFITVIQSLIASFQQAEGQSNTSFSAIQDLISTIIGTIQSVVGAFVELFTAIWNKWGADITAFAEGAFQNIVSVIQNAFDVIKGIADFFIALFTGDWQGCWDAIKNIASSAWELIKSVFKTAVDAVTGILKAGFELLVTIATGLFNLLWEGLKSVWESISTWFSESWNALIEWFGTLGEAFTNIGTGILNWVWNGLKGIWDSIKSWVQSAVDWLKDKLSFWRKAQSEMSSGSSSSSSSSKSVDGSHAEGLSYVPFDNYVALLHKGERVLTTKENAVYSSSYQSSAPIEINYGGIIVQGNADSRTAQLIQDVLRQHSKDTMQALMNAGIQFQPGY